MEGKLVTKELSKRSKRILLLNERTVMKRNGERRGKERIERGTFWIFIYALELC